MYSNYYNPDNREVIMSTTNEKEEQIKQLSEKLQEAMTLKDGTITLNDDLDKVMGTDKEAKALREQRDIGIAAFTDGVGKFGANNIGDSDSVQATTKWGGDSVSVSITKKATYPNPQKGEGKPDTITKHGATRINYSASGTKTGSGELKRVTAGINAAWEKKFSS